MKQVHIFIGVRSVASADVLFEADRMQYRFATNDGIDAGTLIPESYAHIRDEVLGLVGDDALTAEPDTDPDLLFRVLVDGATVAESVNPDYLRRIVRMLLPLSPEMGFLRGFIG